MARVAQALTCTPEEKSALEIRERLAALEAKVASH